MTAVAPRRRAYPSSHADWPTSRSAGGAPSACIATEGTLFALLLFVYFFLRANNHPWPPAGIARPELVKSSIRSVILYRQQRARGVRRSGR